ncbi:MAG: hypothetical protein U5L09_04345 [Bacteroidales bacterium]|nr:hypothetical protein [Bacteroidales bacterium]
MELTEKILADKEMVPLFLQYMKMHLRQQDLPEALPLEAEEKDTSDYLKQVWDFNKSIDPHQCPCKEIQDSRGYRIAEQQDEPAHCSCLRSVTERLQRNRHPEVLDRRITALKK